MGSQPDRTVLKPLQEATRNPLMLGLFLPIQSGAWSPSMAPRGTSWRFDYNAQCTIRAEEFGFDLVFGLAQWMGKGGYGGEMKFRESSTRRSAEAAAVSRASLMKRTTSSLRSLSWPITRSELTFRSVMIWF